jgi:spermidine/putrescine transport system permease protein
MADAATAEMMGPGAPVGERRAPSRRKRLVPYGLLGPGGFWLFIFFVFPLALMSFTSLKTGGLFSGGFRFEFPGAWTNYSTGIGDNGEFFLRSVSYSAIVTVLALLFAYPLAYWIAFYGGRWKSSLLLLMLLPFFVSFVIRTVQWKFILADNNPWLFGFLKQHQLRLVLLVGAGVLGLIGLLVLLLRKGPVAAIVLLGLAGVAVVLSLTPVGDAAILPAGYHVLATNVAVIAGITYNYMPFTALPVYVSLERIDKGLVEAAKDLYASKVQAFLRVVFPLSLPGVFAAFLLTFVPSTGDYVNSDVLGSSATFMIGQRIQYKFLTEFDYPEASAMSIILMIGMLVLASIYARILGAEEASTVAGAA